MSLSAALKTFIREHANDDLTYLLLHADKHKGIDMLFAVEQITARRQIRDKLPEWYANDNLLFPARIAAEQASSESTAIYKQRLLDENDKRLCDLTGGLGVDTYYLSRKAKKVIYMERNPEYCKIAKQNFSTLKAGNISVVKGDSTAMALRLKPKKVDIFYLDPARRGVGNKRLFALEDCEPNLVELLPKLLAIAPKVIAKISPMADIRQILTLLPQTTELHILAVKNDCKELLLVCRQQETPVLSPQIHCVNLADNEEKEQHFTFSLSEENEAVSRFAESVQTFLYEPNAAVMKSGAFRLIGTRYNVGKLSASSHLYTSADFIANFPGRIFRVEEVMPFNNRLCKTIAHTIPQANITVRHFPLTVDQLRKKTSITDGGNTYLFATTLANKERVIIRCRKKGN
ncbi:RsmD family RNA methyltransferase [Parabacteroides sp. OttesenSCG-928-G07]|nr:RsmD family RNA methyltransferase [Parabacteroides sp. OttesenSCG-928-G07]